MSKMMTKVVTALVLIAICLPPIIFGGKLMNVLLLVVSALASYEIASLQDQKPHWVFTVLCFIAINVISYVSEVFVGASISIWLVVLFVAEIVDDKLSTSYVMYPFALTCLVGFALRCVLKIYTFDLGPYILLYVLLACFVCDTGAYFFGVSIGKHKMIERISPNKTWEGAIGGYLTALVVSLAFGLIVLDAMPKELIICGSIVLPAIGEIGDLAFSSIKRKFKIKDFGNLLPEHGGVLDRVDSLIFCLMVFNALMILWRLIG